MSLCFLDKTSSPVCIYLYVAHKISRKLVIKSNWIETGLERTVLIFVSGEGKETGEEPRAKNSEQGGEQATK